MQSNITIKTVQTHQELKQFVDFRSELYKSSPIDLPYLFDDEMNTLTKGKNPALEFCQAEYYLAYDSNNRIVGRVAAIINPRANEKWQSRAVRIGWFDFIDDFNVSRALVDAVKNYGRKHGMDNIIGPMGFTDMDREGMLVEGFEHMASLHANHNFEYYRRHMEQMPEFQKDNDWIQLAVNIKDVPEKFTRLTSQIEQRYNLHSRKLTRHQILHEGYGHQLFNILNECYAHLYCYSRLDDQQVDELVNTYMKIIDMNLISIIFDDNCNKMVGFGVCLPSFSEAMRKTRKGRMLPFGWFHLLKTLKFKTTKTLDLLLVGVLPEYRAKGANALIFEDITRTAKEYGFTEALTMAMMETNDNVLSQWQYYDTQEVMRLRSYKASL